MCTPCCAYVTTQHLQQQQQQRALQGRATASRATQHRLRPLVMPSEELLQAYAARGRSIDYAGCSLANGVTFAWPKNIVMATSMQYANIYNLRLTDNIRIS